MIGPSEQQKPPSQDILQPAQAVGLSTAAKAELMDECEDQFSELRTLLNEIIIADTAGNNGGSYEVVNRLNALTAEFEQWQETTPKLLPTNPDTLLAVGREEQRINTQLKMVLSCSQAKLDALKDTLKREQSWLAEKKEVLKAITERAEAVRLEGQGLSEHSVVQDMKRKIRQVKEHQSNLMEALSDMLAEHFPPPETPIHDSKKRRASVFDAGPALISLSEIIERLTNKTLETPHEPYVTIDEAFWPPYTEMLLRNGIAMRHPEDCNKLRLENFL